MLSRRSIGWCLIGLLCLSGCGFEPVYGDRPGQTDTIEVLPFITVLTTGGLQGEMLKARIEDRLNPKSISVPARYQLKVDLQTQADPYIIQQDGTASRYILRFIAPYRLIRLSDNQELSKGTIHHQISYNVSERDDYSTFVAQQDASRRGLTEIAEDIKLRIGAVVSRATYRP